MLPGETLARKKEDGPDGERARAVFGKRTRVSATKERAELYEIAGRPASAAVNPRHGDQRWAAALMYVRVHGVEKSESVYTARTPRARVSCTGHAGTTTGISGESLNP